jgi:hypothetical protein
MIELDDEKEEGVSFSVLNHGSLFFESAVVDR